MAKLPDRTETKPAAWRRLAVLALAIAVPLAAVPLSDLGSRELGGVAHAKANASELPAENFPGSAFYFLEDAPDLAEQVQPVSNDTASKLDPTTTTVAQPFSLIGSDRDHARAQRCMTMALHYEASGESAAGKRAVAQVVLNRVAHPAFPATVCGVVFQGAERSTGCQFSFACDGAMARRIEAGFTGTEARIAREALAGAVYAPVGHATHFHTLEVSPYWAPSLTNVTTIGAHVFYRWRGEQSRAAAFNVRYRGGEPEPGKVRPISVPPPPYAAPAPTPAINPEVEQQSVPQHDAAPRLPSSGEVREEYANSGQWIARP